MTEQIEELYDHVKMILEPSLFWDMTLYEIQEYQEIYTYKEKSRAKENILYMQILSESIIHGVAFVIGSTKEKPKRLIDDFPHLFEEENVYKKDIENKLYIAKFKDFALRHNNQRKEGKSNG